MSTKPLPLRTRHRQDTRRRLAEAAYELAAERGIDQLRAEAIAERAGVSRRTFFNYLTSAEAALSIPIEDFLEAVRLEFVARPAGESVFDAMASALSSVDAELVDRLARVVAISGTDQAPARYQLATWERYERAVREILAGRLGPSVDPLYVSTLAAAVMGAGRAAVAAWAARRRHAERARSARRVAELTEFFIRAVRYLGDSFRSPKPARARGHAR